MSGQTSEVQSCPECGRTFAAQGLMREHFFAEHLVTEAETEATSAPTDTPAPEGAPTDTSSHTADRAVADSSPQRLPRGAIRGSSWKVTKTDLFFFLYVLVLVGIIVGPIAVAFGVL